MSEPSGVLRHVEWNEVFPWLMIFRAVRLSLSAPILFVATVATLLLPLGWRAAELVRVNKDQFELVQRFEPERRVISSLLADADTTRGVSIRLPQTWSEFFHPFTAMLASAVNPPSRLFGMDVTWREFAYYGIGSLWNVAVWAFFGGLIVRTAVMLFGRDERVGLFDAARFARRRYFAFAGAPLFVLAGIVVVVAFSYPVGWVMRANVGLLLVSLVWIFVLLGGLFITTLFLGTLFGWPLMWGALSTEEMGDVFEAAQRSFSYTFGRPFHYAWYGLVALVVGSLTFVIVQLFAQLVVYFSTWAVSWGSGIDALSSVGNADSSVRVVGGSIIAWLNGVVITVASAFRYSFLWCAAGAIYLLLRRDSDQIEIDNVYVDDEQTHFALPPLSTDEAGVPGVSDE